MRKLLIFISVLLTVSVGQNQLLAQSKVKLQGRWDCFVSASDIIEAGNDYIGTYESGDSEVQFSVNDGFWPELLGYNWSVSIRKSDVDWDNTAKIYVQRTSDGTPYLLNGTVTGGTSYQQVNDTEMYFFSGNRGRQNIEIQYRLQGVSVVMKAQTYTTYIIYTVSSL